MTVPAIITPPRVPLLDPRSGLISREWFLFFQQLQRNTEGVGDAAVLTPDDETQFFPNSVQLIPASGELERLLDPSTFTLGLADTGVAADTYGAATKLVVLAIDAKGRVTSASEVDLNSDNVTEGATNLFFTVARARQSLSGVDGIDYDNTSGVIDTQGFSGTAGPLVFNKGIAQSGTAVAGDDAVIAGGAVNQLVVQDGIVTLASGVAGFTGTVTPPLSLTFVDGICTAAS